MELPSEIEAFYVIPSVRRELARLLVKEGLSQRAAAQKLGVTEAAISQYLSNKRGVNFEYPAPIAAKFNTSAKKIANSKTNNEVRTEIEQLCKLIKDDRVMCELHKKIGNVKDGCCECYQ